MNEQHYVIKDKTYFANIRTDIISLIPVNPNQKILEIGAGSGNTLLFIKENKLAKEVMGVELMRMPGTNQENGLIDKFQIANIEQEEIAAADEYFDVIICADVLEHLVDPWKAVNRITRHLKKNGLLLVSIPNIREWKTLAGIIFKGNFQYNPEGGIMDRTHLRFFCKKNVQQLLTTPELTPIYSIPNFMLKAVTEGKKRRLLNKLSFRLFENFLAVQYLFIAKKNG